MNDSNTMHAFIEKSLEEIRLVLLRLAERSYFESENEDINRSDSWSMISQKLIDLSTLVFMTARDIRQENTEQSVSGVGEIDLFGLANNSIHIREVCAQELNTEMRVLIEAIYTCNNPFTKRELQRIYNLNKALSLSLIKESNTLVKKLPHLQRISS